jgi:mannose-6-phosphate isomerase-like protein (cupin superfamily)
MRRPINLEAAFSRITEHWRPVIAGEVNDMHVKLAKLHGAFDWHHHETEDELFLVISGRLLMRFRDEEVWIEPGEFLVVPRGVEHCPVAPDECQVVLFEPRSTLNTGTKITERTVLALERVDARE